MTATICLIENCETGVLARGWCVKHYQRWRKWGDPLKDPQTPEERFWAKVDKNGPVPEHRPDLGPCWLWVGALMDTGYGMCRHQGRTALAHRVAFLMAERPIPLGFVIDHLCNVRPCVNHGHLEAVTLAENVSRANRRGAYQRYRALQRAKTACPQGHPYDTVNTYVSKAGKRSCKQCAKERSRLGLAAVKENRRLRERIAELEAQIEVYAQVPSPPAAD